MRHTATVTSLSWIPATAITGVMKLPMTIGVTHYDDPPPEHLSDLEALREADRFRFANALRGWAEISDGRIVDAGFGEGGGVVGSTTLRLMRKRWSIPAVPFEDLRRGPTIAADGRSVDFVQTSGGRTGAPMPRTVHRPPFVQITSPIAWTTLRLTIRADGTNSFDLDGASPFPRHWIYDDSGEVVRETGLIDYIAWSKDFWGEHTPWGDFDSEAVVAEVESSLERHLAMHIMKEGTKPRILTLRQREVLVEQGEESTELFVLLDGILTIERDGEQIAEVGPGTVIGEMAVVGGGRRTATVRAATKAKVARAAPEEVDLRELEELASRREA